MVSRCANGAHRLRSTATTTRPSSSRRRVGSPRSRRTRRRSGWRRPTRLMTAATSRRNACSASGRDPDRPNARPRSTALLRATRRCGSVGTRRAMLVRDQGSGCGCAHPPTRRWLPRNREGVTGITGTGCSRSSRLDIHCQPSPSPKERCVGVMRASQPRGSAQ